VLTTPLPNSLRPFTLDQVRLLRSDNVLSRAADAEGRTLQGLGVPRLHTAESIVPAYVERFRPRGQFARYRG
jgi:NADH dehydrogenase